MKKSSTSNESSESKFNINSLNTAKHQVKSSLFKTTELRKENDGEMNDSNDKNENDANEANNDNNDNNDYKKGGIYNSKLKLNHTRGKSESDFSMLKKSNKLLLFNTYIYIII